MKYVKLIAKPDEWYKEGTEAFYDDSTIHVPIVPIKRLTKQEFEKRLAEWGCGMMVGMRVPDPERNYELKYHQGKWYVDGECCPLDEFEIVETEEYVEFQNRDELYEWYEQGN
jgi:hypothetical protein